MFQNFTSVASHEIIESTTDPLVADSVNIDYPMGWYDPSNGEIGDICQGTDGTITAANGTVYTVQTQWSNARNVCVYGP